MARLITMAEYLASKAHAIFRKRVKEGGRETDNLWLALGGGLDAVRLQIVDAANMMHPATAEGDYLDRWGRNLNGLYRVPGETDAAYAAFLADAGAVWELVGSTGALTALLLRAGWTVEVTVHPSRPLVRIVTVQNGPGLTTSLQLVADIYKFRAAHLLHLIELAGDVEYAGADYYPIDGSTWTGWDDVAERPAIDYFKDFGV